MLPWWVSNCEIDGHAIFLDIKRNRYLATRSEVGRALIVGDYEAVPRPILDQVIALGWRNDNLDQPDFASVRVEQPKIEFSSIAGSMKTTKRLVGSALASIIIARCQLATTSFERLLRNVAIANNRASNAPKRASIDEVIYAAEIVERIAFGPRACLLKALAQQKLLSRHGHASALVFGVRLNPFSAHCWLQQRDVVINDTIERVGMFTIVRAVQ